MRHTSVSAESTTYYVDNTNTTTVCSDDPSGPQGTIDRPFCTIARGAFKAAVPGDTVHVLAGTYAETVFVEHSGTAGNPISFQAEPGVTVTGRTDGTDDGSSAFSLGGRSYIVIDGFTITQTRYIGIYVASSDHITISNNHVSYAGVTSTTHPYEQGIFLRDTTDSTITGNTTDHNTCIGIRLVKSDNNLISNNVSFSNYSHIETDAAGIELTGSRHNTVINNITYSNEDSGINVYLYDPAPPAEDVASSYNLVIGNLSYENGDHGIDTNNSPYNTLIGNTVQGNGTVGINFEGEIGTGSHHATALNNISAGNGFTPPDGRLLRLAATCGWTRPRSKGRSWTTTCIDRQSAAVQIIWDNDDYLTLAALRAAAPTQEGHGLEGDPLLCGPGPVGPARDRGAVCGGRAGGGLQPERRLPGHRQRQCGCAQPAGL